MSNFMKFWMYAAFIVCAFLFLGILFPENLPASANTKLKFIIFLSILTFTLTFLMVRRGSRKYIFALLMALVVGLMLSGCGTPQTVVKVEHILVAPSDNLLVSCDIAAPPDKSMYLKGFVKDSSLTTREDILAQYNRALKGYQERERALIDTLLKNYEYQHICNTRWAKLRDWKATSMKELATPPPKGSK